MSVQIVTTEFRVDFKDHERFLEILKEEARAAGIAEDDILAIGNALDKQARSIADVEKRLRSERTEAARLEKALKGATDEADQNKFQAELKETETRIKSLTAEAKKLSDTDVEFDLSGIGSGVGDALQGALPSSLGSLTDLFAGGLATAGIGALVGIIAGGTAELAEFSKELAELRGQAEQLTGATGESLDTITARAQAIAQSYEGLSEIDVFRNAQQGVSIFNESLDRSSQLLRDALSTQADGGNELLSTFESVADRLARGNVSLETTFALIAGEQGLVGEAGKGIEAIAEAVTSLGEATPATREAIEGLGLDADQIFDLFANDGFAAITTITNRLQELPPTSAAVGTALADIFRGPGEDAVTYVRNLGQVETNLQNVVDQSGEFARVQRESTEASEALNKTFNDLLGSSGNFFTEVETGAKVLLNDFLISGIRRGEDLINFFVRLYNNSLQVRAGLQIVAAVARTAFAVISGAVSNAINGVETFGRVIGAVLTGEFSRIPSIIDEGLTQGVDTIIQSGSDIGSAWSDAFNNTVDPKPLEKVSLLGNDEGSEAAKNFNQGFNGNVKIDPVASSQLDSLAARARNLFNSGSIDLAGFNGLRDELDALNRSSTPKGIEDLNRKLEELEDKAARNAAKEVEKLRGELDKLQTAAQSIDLSQIEEGTNTQFFAGLTADLDELLTSIEQAEIDPKVNAETVKQLSADLKQAQGDFQALQRFSQNLVQLRLEVAGDDTAEGLGILRDRAINDITTRFKIKAEVSTDTLTTEDELAKLLFDQGIEQNTAELIATRIFQVDAEFRAKINEATRNEAVQQLKEENQRFEEEIKQIGNQTISTTFATLQAESVETEALERQRAEGLINETEYQFQLADIQNRFAKQRAEAVVNQLESQRAQILSEVTRIQSAIAAINESPTLNESQQAQLEELKAQLLELQKAAIETGDKLKTELKVDDAEIVKAWDDLTQGIQDVIEGNLDPDKIAGLFNSIKTVFDDLRESLSDGFQLSDLSDVANTAIAINQSVTTARLANLEREKEIAIANAGDSAEARERIEREFAERAKRIAINQAKIQLGLSVLRVLSTVPFPLSLAASTLILGIGLRNIRQMEAAPAFEEGVEALTRSNTRTPTKRQRRKLPLFGNRKGVDTIGAITPQGDLIRVNYFERIIDAGTNKRHFGDFNAVENGAFRPGLIEELEGVNPALLEGIAKGDLPTGINFPIDPIFSPELKTPSLAAPNFALSQKLQRIEFSDEIKVSLSKSERTKLAQAIAKENGFELGQRDNERDVKKKQQEAIEATRPKPIKTNQDHRQ